MATNYLPNLESLISTSDIPEELGIIQQALEPMFQHLFYQNFEHAKSSSGDNTAVSMELVANTRIAWDVEGTDGFAFVDGSCYPSKNHVNGSALDSKYSTKANTLVFMRALNHFGFGWHYVGDSTAPGPQIYNDNSVTHDRTHMDADHNDHLHSGKLTLIDGEKSL